MQSRDVGVFLLSFPPPFFSLRLELAFLIFHSNCFIFFIMILLKQKYTQSKMIANKKKTPTRNTHCGNNFFHKFASNFSPGWACATEKLVQNIRNSPAKKETAMAFRGAFRFSRVARLHISETQIIADLKNKFNISESEISKHASLISSCCKAYTRPVPGAAVRSQPNSFSLLVLLFLFCTFVVAIFCLSKKCLV